jgi:DNA-directed RNA polymerase subunit RPC12/RpoP
VANKLAAIARTSWADCADFVYHFANSYSAIFCRHCSGRIFAENSHKLKVNAKARHMPRFF